MRSRGWALAVIFVVFLYISFSLLNSIAKSRSPRGRNDIIVRRENPFKRLNSTLLHSVLAHVEVGYVANRTPDFDTPPLLVLYSCHGPCGAFEQRLQSIASAYVFGMLWDGAAVGIDMTAPVKFDWFFEAAPGYMVMNAGQVQFYLERADPASVRTADTMAASELASTDFVAEYTSQNVRVLKSAQWGPWWSMRDNPSMKRPRDKYRLAQLAPSEGFWVASQLLFSKPSAWLAAHLTPYLDLMGGHMHRDPLHPGRPDDDTAVLARWTRIGVRSDGQGTACIAARVASVCSKAQVMGKECHVFLSAPSPDALEQLRAAVHQHQHKHKQRPLIVHAVADAYEFTPPSAFVSDHDDASRDPSDEPRLKLKHARTFMDWILLSRMDYLIGVLGDDYLKTAAWAAQVHTDLYHPPSAAAAAASSPLSDDGNQCTIQPMASW